MSRNRCENFRRCYELDKLTNTIYKGDIENFKKYLRKQLHLVNYRDHNGLTPLHVAVKMNSFEILEILLRLPDIDPGILNFNKETSLFMAFTYNADVRIVERLMRAGYDVNTCDNRNRTYLHVCTHTSFTKFANIFIKHGADVNAVDKDGLTPLHEAVRTRNLEYVQMLLYYRADVTVKCYKNGSTAFTKALKIKSLNIAYELLDYQVDFEEGYFDGQTTFALAMSCSHALAEAILDRGYDIGYSVMNDTLMHGNRRMFKKVWPLIDKRILIEVENEFMVDYLVMCTYTNDEWLECLYDILESEIAIELVVESMNNTFSLLQAFDIRNLERSVRVKIIYLFFSLGLPVGLYDALKFYKTFGHDEEFEVFLYMDPIKFSVPLWRYSCIPGLFALHFEADINENLTYLITRHCSGLFFEIRFYLKEILSMVNFCTIKKSLREEFFTKNVIDTNFEIDDCIEELFELHDKVAECFNKMDEVPKLIELCRNCVRYFISENALLKKPCYYNTFLNSLKLPDLMKDIIRFKRNIYTRTDFMY